MKRGEIRGGVASGMTIPGFHFAHPGYEERALMARIGFIGLGNMGLPMAQNLLKAGHQVEGVDVNPHAVEKLKAAGGTPVEMAPVAAARADVVITMLPAGQHVREVYLGANGIIQ